MNTPNLVNATKTKPGARGTPGLGQRGVSWRLIKPLAGISPANIPRKSMALATLLLSTFFLHVSHPLSVGSVIRDSGITDGVSVYGASKNSLALFCGSSGCFVPSGSAIKPAMLFAARNI